ncbi:MAG: hypothetical protein U0792_09045 [Gemmataceae bacterium]
MVVAGEAGSVADAAGFTRESFQAAGVEPGGTFGPGHAATGHLELRDEEHEHDKGDEREPRREQSRAKAQPRKKQDEQEHGQTGVTELIEPQSQSGRGGTPLGEALGVYGRGRIRIGHLDSCSQRER